MALQKLWLAPIAFVFGAAYATPDTMIMDDGRRIRGELVSISRNTVVFDRTDGLSGGTRRMRVNLDAVRRINFTDEDELFDDDGLTTDEGFGFPDSGRDILVRADQQWTDIGITVRAGDVIRIDADGFVNWAPNRNDGPQGEVNSPYNANRPVPNRPAGALIGRIGNGEPFFIGTGNSFRARNAGRLYLGINDDYLRDNTGSFRVRVSR